MRSLVFVPLTLLGFAGVVFGQLGGLASILGIAPGPLNTGSSPNVVDTAENNQCATYFLVELFADVCPLAVAGQGGPNYTVNTPLGNQYTLDICDSHCRCTHGAQWGQCINRTAGTPGAAVALSNLTCKCYYSAPPPGLPTNNNLLDDTSVSPFSVFGCAPCLAWYLTPFSLKVPGYCNAISNAPLGSNSTGNCNTDCVCVHEYDMGVCDEWCSCYYKDGTQTKNGV